VTKTRAKKKQRRRAREVTSPTKPATPSAAAGAERKPSASAQRNGVPRPDAIWSPFPLTEIGMAVGLMLFLVGFASTAAVLFAGIVVLFVVVGELCLREHFAGFRSHTLLLALLPVTAVHSAIVIVGGVALRAPVVLAVDLAVAGGLASWLRRRFALAQAAASPRAS
jgi:hypothetical protein